MAIKDELLGEKIAGGRLNIMLSEDLGGLQPAPALFLAPSRLCGATRQPAYRDW